MKKILFTISVDNTIDIITNSSSELFVLNGETLNSVKELVESIYPEYRKEYEEIVALRDANDSDVDTYVSWIEDSSYDKWDYTRGMSKEKRKQYLKVLLPCNYLRASAAQDQRTIGAHFGEIFD